MDPFCCCRKGNKHCTPTSFNHLIYSYFVMFRFVSLLRPQCTANLGNKIMQKVDSCEPERLAQVHLKIKPKHFVTHVKIDPQLHAIYLFQNNIKTLSHWIRVSTANLVNQTVKLHRSAIFAKIVLWTKHQRICNSKC